MTVDVVVLNCNSGSMLEKCFENLKKTIHPIRIIIVDNGSKDYSLDFLEHEEDYLLIKNNENLGCPRGLNKALPYLENEYVAFLNEDILPFPNWLEMPIKYMNKHDWIYACGLKLIFPNGEIEQDGTYIDILTSTAGGIKGGFKQPDITPYTGLGNIILRKEVFNLVGEFEGNYFLYWDDAEFCIRIWKKKKYVYYFPNSKAIHYHQVSIKRNMSLFVANYYAYRNSIITLLIHGNRRELKKYIPTSLFYMFFKSGLGFIKERRQMILSIVSIFGVIKNLRWILKSRYKNNYYDGNLFTYEEISKINLYESIRGIKRKKVFHRIFGENPYDYIMEKD